MPLPYKILYFQDNHGKPTLSQKDLLRDFEVTYDQYGHISEL